MDLTLLLAIAIFLLLAGAGLIYLTLRGNESLRPVDGFQWAAVGLSSILVFLSAFLIVLIARAPEGTRFAGSPVANAGLNEPAQNFAFRQVADDTEMELADYEGKVVLLNFWATWCAPCLSEMPELNRLYETYRDAGLVVLTISDEPRQDLLAFDQEIMEIKTISGYVPGPDALPQPFSKVVDVRPLTFIIDREGIIRQSMVGAGDFEAFADAVAPYLEREVAAR